MYRILRGQFIGTGINVRFDDDEIRTSLITQPSDYGTTSRSISPVNDSGVRGSGLYRPGFLTFLRRAAVVHLEATFYHEGLQILEFPVAPFKLPALPGDDLK